MNAVHAMQPGVQRVRFDVELLGCLCNGEPVFTNACKALADHLLECWVVSCSLVGHEYFLLAARTGLAALYRYTVALTKKPYVTESLTLTVQKVETSGQKLLKTSPVIVWLRGFVFLGAGKRCLPWA